MFFSCPGESYKQLQNFEEKSNKAKTSLRKSMHLGKSACRNGPAQIDQKPIQYGAKDMPGGGLETPWGLGGRSGLVFRRNRKSMKTLKASGTRPERLGRLPGIRRAPKNRPKITLLLKNCFPIVDSLSILERNTVFRAF